MDIANAIPTKYRGDPHERSDTIVVNSERGLAPHGSMAGELEVSPPLTESEHKGHTFVFKASHYTRAKDGAPSDVSPPLSADADKGDQDPLVFDTTQVTHPANYSRPRPGDPSHPLARDGHPPTLAFNIYPAAGQGADLEASATETGNIGGRYAASERGTRVLSPVTYGFDKGQSSNPKATEQVREEQAPPLISERVTGISVAGALLRPRRMTPRECERLHGFPDDWTLRTTDGAGRTGRAKDTPRYRALGNAVSVPVAHWIGERIRRAHEST